MRYAAVLFEFQHQKIQDIKLFAVYSYRDIFQHFLSGDRYATKLFELCSRILTYGCTTPQHLKSNLNVYEKYKSDEADSCT